MTNQVIKEIINNMVLKATFVFVFCSYLWYVYICRYWPVIDDALRRAAFDRKVSVKLLISYWNNTWKDMQLYLKSLNILKYSDYGVYTNIEVVCNHIWLVHVSISIYKNLKNLVDGGFIQKFIEFNISFNVLMQSFKSLL